ncbi:hypothetical protein ACIQM4_28370 [Streptomyces sp. NPDC091272]|uniref:hypothetical protein n=1 Tax=Streptomyces sp. NPDC091272 TaxID=3365981 RepID=UPI003823A6B4
MIFRRTKSLRLTLPLAATAAVLAGLLAPGAAAAPAPGAPSLGLPGDVLSMPLQNALQVPLRAPRPPEPVPANAAARRTGPRNAREGEAADRRPEYGVRIQFHAVTDCWMRTGRKAHVIPVADALHLINTDPASQACDACVSDTPAQLY